jgi:hypothetical protein
MKELTMQEVLELIEFERDLSGVLLVKKVKSSVWGNVEGAVYGDVYGDVGCSVWGNVKGNVGGDVYGHVKGGICGGVGGNIYNDVKGDVYGAIKGREWDFVETNKERAIRLMRQGEIEEAIKVLEENE